MITRSTVLAIVLVLSAIRVVAQGQEATPLPFEDLGFTLPGAEAVLALDTTTFLRGWNWVEMDSMSSAALNVNFWHWRDPWLWQGKQRAGTGEGADPLFAKEHQPRQLLTIAVDGVSSNPHRSHVTSTTEAIAMEYQPWLEHRNGSVTLLDDDSTGGIFAFKRRSLKGAVIRGEDSCYRFRLSTDAFVGSEHVLSNVEFDDAFFRLDGFADGFDTDTLWIAINLRRSDSLPDDNGDEAVVRIRIPYWLGDACRTDSSFARFRFLPVANGTAIIERSTLGRVMGVRWPTFTDTSASTDFVITRRMLPAFDAAERDITVYAGILFDHDESGKPLHKWNNPQLNPEVWSKAEHLIERLGINVEFMDELGVDIKWIRIETPEARRLFWGQKDRYIAEHMREFMQNMIAFKEQYHHADEEQPRLHRIYGRDEIRLAHFKGFRYINRLLHHYVTTEWDVVEFERAKHCLVLREFWQGRSCRPHDRTYSPTFLHGCTWHNAADSVNLYCGYRIGRADVVDYETDVYGVEQIDCRNSRTVHWSPRPLPIPSHLLDTFITAYSGGMLTVVEHHLRSHMLPNVSMLFDTSVTWIQNVWIYSSGTIGVYPDVRYTLTTNGRPKSAEEVRLQHWLPLILGAKGLIEYAGKTTGTVSSNIDWASQSRPGALPWTMSVVRDVGTQYTSDDAINNVLTMGDARIDDDALGPDYLEKDEPDNLDRYITKGLTTTAMAMNMHRADAPGLYLGRKSARQVIREVFTTLDPYWSTLTSLQLKAWRAKGYDRWLAGDTTVFDQWLRRGDADYAAWVLNEPQAGSTVLPRKESYDSTFFDITLHQAGDTSTADVIYIGILNRRTSGLTPEAPYDRFHTYDQFRSYVHDSSATAAQRLYRQNGARRIRLPFNVEGGAPTPVRLHVQELRQPSDVVIERSEAIDRVVDATGYIDVDLLPGEGKFLRVSVVR